MMEKRFRDFSEFANYITKVAKSYELYRLALLDRLGEKITEKSKDMIGHLQTDNGRFAFSSWPELAPSTIQDKINKGYAFNADFNPLYRTGEMKESIQYTIMNNEVSIGSNSEIALAQEMGTKNIPARSFLGLAMYKSKYFIEGTLTDFFHYWFMQKTPLFNKTHL